MRKILLTIIFLLILNINSYSQAFVGGSTSSSLNIGVKMKFISLILENNFKYTKYKNIYNFNNINTIESRKLFTITPMIGIKLNLPKKPLSPYLYFSVGKSIPLINKVSGFDDNNRRESIYADQNNDMRFKSGIGLDLYIDKLGFSVESGIKYLYFEYDLQNILYMSDNKVTISDVTYLYNEINYYFIFNFNYYF